MDSTQPYNLSFTAASLRPDLCRIVAAAYLESGDWGVAKNRILSSNALQARTTSSSARMERELRQRLTKLTPGQIELLAHATTEDRSAIAWLAACKHIRFVSEFASQTLRTKLEDRDPVLRPSDYESFLESEQSIHSEVSRLTASSKSKVRQVLLRMLLEAGLLEKGSALGTIQRPPLSARVHQAITLENSAWLAVFLVPESEILSR